MFRTWLKYNNFPTFEIPSEPAGGGAAPAEPAIATPAEPVETPAEISETEAFALEAFEQGMEDEPEDEPLRPLREPVVEAVEPPVATPVATPVVAAEKPLAQTPVAPTAGVATPPVPAAGTQTATQPGVVPATPTEPAASTVVTAPDEQTLHGLAEQLNAQRDVFVKQLAQHRYKFTEAELERFNTEPGEFIAEVAARVQVETTQSLMRVMWSQLPGLINSTVNKKVVEDSAENAFWGANPALDRAKHAALVSSVAPVFRKNFPTADASTFNKHVGAMVLGMLGQTALAVQQQALPNGSHPPVATPGRVVRVVSAPSFAPAGGHAAPAAPVTASKGEWETLFELTRRDDAGEFES